MRLSLTKLETIALTIITILRMLSPLCLLLLVRLGGYIVNLCAFYFYKLIGKLTAFLQLQEFSFHNRWTVPLPPRGVLLTTQIQDCNILAKAAALRITLNIDGAPLASRSHTHQSHSQTSRLLTSSLSLSVPVPRATQCMRGV
jgi:hypothetical protein